MSRAFFNDPGNWSLFPGGVITKTQKWYLVLSRLTFSIIRYRSSVKLSSPGEEVALFPPPQYSIYRKGVFGSPSTNVTNFNFHLFYPFVLILDFWCRGPKRFRYQYFAFSIRLWISCFTLFNVLIRVGHLP